MELIKTPYRIRCEMGVCKNVASHTVMLSRCGVKSRIHICDDCMKELYALIGQTLKEQGETPPDTTLKKRKGKKNAE